MRSGLLVIATSVNLLVTVCGAATISLDGHASSAGSMPPLSAEPLFHAEALVADDKAEQAIEILKEIVDRSPEMLRPRLVLGSALMQAGKTDEAASVLCEVTKKWPQNSEAQLLLAYVRLDQGDKPRAREGFEKVLDIATHGEQRSAAHLGLASLYENEGQLTEADIHYRKALEIEPGLREFLMTVQKQLLWRQPTAAPADDSGHAVPSQVRIDGMKDELRKLRDGHKDLGGSGNE